MIGETKFFYQSSKYMIEYLTRDEICTYESGKEPDIKMNIDHSSLFDCGKLAINLHVKGTHSNYLHKEKSANTRMVFFRFFEAEMTIEAIIKNDLKDKITWIVETEGDYYDGLQIHYVVGTPFYRGELPYIPGYTYMEDKDYEHVLHVVSDDSKEIKVYDTSGKEGRV